MERSVDNCHMWFVFLATLLGFAATSRPVHAFDASDVHIEWLALRADIEAVQNTTGNAFALRGGLSPTLHIKQSPIGLRLLVEYGALRTTTAQVFSVPSVQLLATWACAPRLDLGIGAGTQFWIAQGANDARLLVTLEAHYVLPRRWARVLHAGFAAASIGPSSTSGLQARLGVELRFGPTTAAERAAQAAEARSPDAYSRPEPSPASGTTPLALVCPPCPAGPSCPACDAAQACPKPLPAQNVVLPSPVLFAFDSAVVPPQEVAYLSQLGAVLAAQSDAWVTVALTGHATAVGARGHNLILSVARARAVADVLEAAGVQKDRITIAGVGATQPIAGSGPDDVTQQRVMLELFGSRVDARLQALIDGAALLPKEAAP